VCVCVCVCVFMLSYVIVNMCCNVFCSTEHVFAGYTIRHDVLCIGWMTYLLDYSYSLLCHWHILKLTSQGAAPMCVIVLGG